MSKQKRKLWICDSKPSRSESNLLIISDVVRHILLLFVCGSIVCLRGGGPSPWPNTVRVQHRSRIIPIIIIIIIVWGGEVALALARLCLKLAVRPFARPANLPCCRSFTGAVLSLWAEWHVVDAGFKPGTDAYVSAVHQLIYLGDKKKCNSLAFKHS